MYKYHLTGQHAFWNKLLALDNAWNFNKTLLKHFYKASVRMVYLSFFEVYPVVNSQSKNNSPGQGAILHEKVADAFPWQSLPP